MTIISFKSKAEQPKRQAGPCTICHLHDCQDKDAIYYLFRLYEAVRENILHLFVKKAAALQEKPQSILQKPACYFLTRTDPVLRPTSTLFNIQRQPSSTLIFVACN